MKLLTGILLYMFSVISFATVGFMWALVSLGEYLTIMVLLMILLLMVVKE